MIKKKKPSAIPYSLIDHTADLGIQVFGETIEQLFTNAGLALFDLITSLKKIKGEHQVLIEIEGMDTPDLLVNWLRELLYLWNGEEKLVGRIGELVISGNFLRAVVTYDDYHPDEYVIRHEIKAVTHHQAAVERKPGCWEATVVLDT